MLSIIDRFGDELLVEQHGWEDKENWVSLFITMHSESVEIELSPDQVSELIAYLQSTQERKNA